jgi:hypothetical protein
MGQGEGELRTVADGFASARRVTPPKNGATDYRLVVGPFPTLAAASRLCVRFNVTRRPAKFAGEEVVLR